MIHSNGQMVITPLCFLVIFDVLFSVTRVTSRMVLDNTVWYLFILLFYVWALAFPWLELGFSYQQSRTATPLIKYTGCHSFQRNISATLSLVNLIVAICFDIFYPGISLSLYSHRQAKRRPHRWGLTRKVPHSFFSVLTHELYNRELLRTSPCLY